MTPPPELYFHTAAPPPLPRGACADFSFPQVADLATAMHRIASAGSQNPDAVTPRPSPPRNMRPPPPDSVPLSIGHWRPALPEPRHLRGEAAAGQPSGVQRAAPRKRSVGRRQAKDAAQAPLPLRRGTAPASPPPPAHPAPPLPHLTPRPAQKEVVRNGRKLSDFSPQQLAAIAWSFATVGIEAPRLFDAVQVSPLSFSFSFSLSPCPCLCPCLCPSLTHPSMSP